MKLWRLHDEIDYAEYVYDGHYGRLRPRRRRWDDDIIPLIPARRREWDEIIPLVPAGPARFNPQHWEEPVLLSPCAWSGAN